MKRKINWAKFAQIEEKPFQALSSLGFVPPYSKERARGTPNTRAYEGIPTK